MTAATSERWRSRWPTQDAARRYLRTIQDLGRRQEMADLIGVELKTSPLAKVVLVQEKQAEWTPVIPSPETSPPGSLQFIIPALPCFRKAEGKIDRSKPKVPKLVGYYTKGAQPNYSRASEYNAWKDHVRRNVQPTILPPTGPRHPVRVDVWCYFPRGVHSDPENVRKGIVDAMFPRGDKFVFGYHHHPLYDPACPRAEIVITSLSATLFEETP